MIRQEEMVNIVSDVVENLFFKGSPAPTNQKNDLACSEGGNFQSFGIYRDRSAVTVAIVGGREIQLHISILPDILTTFDKSILFEVCINFTQVNTSSEAYSKILMELQECFTRRLQEEVLKYIWKTESITDFSRSALDLLESRKVENG